MTLPIPQAPRALRQHIPFTSDRPAGRRWYRLRSWLMLPLIFTMALCTWGECEHEMLMAVLGGAVFLGGGILRVWANMHLHYRLKVRKALTTTGPYALVRNPIYIANTLLLLGLCVGSEVPWLCPLVLLYCGVVYSFVVRQEEAHLAVKYGEPYRQYLRDVPRWMPRLGARRAGGGRARAFLLRSAVWELHLLLWLAVPLLKELA
jgi:protein-S-isoprenylcysteine O-methyltransferase Ste14